MHCLAIPAFSFRRVAVLACAVVLLGCGSIDLRPAAAAAGPFAEFPGHWSGSGIIRVRSNEGEHTERIRCDASYDVRDPRDINIRLTCKSDTYNFDLIGDFQADAQNHVSGNWSENSRNIAGTATGVARGNQLQVHVESSALNGNLGVATRRHSQSVSLEAAGAGQSVTASVTLHRTSR
jgi:hypothetical protein